MNSNLLAFFCVAILIVLFKCDEDADWKSYKKAHGKKYKDNTDEDKRRAIWKGNRDYIAKHNADAAAGKHTFEVGETIFADMTNAEFVAQFASGISQSDLHAFKSRRAASQQTSQVKALPSSVDWRTKGWVTAVKNQGRVGKSFSKRLL
jgi:C1A family cysteine protease